MSFKQYCKELLSHYKEIVSADGRNIVTDGYIIISTPIVFKNTPDYTNKLSGIHLMNGNTTSRVYINEIDYNNDETVIINHIRFKSDRIKIICNTAKDLKIDHVTMIYGNRDGFGRFKITTPEGEIHFVLAGANT